MTVVIPTRDRWTLLSRTALRAALSQTGVDVEVVIVEDGSSTQAPDGLPGLDDVRVRCVRHTETRGVATARNAGLREARGEWVAFLDDDDVWSPQKLRLQIDAARAADAGFAYGAAFWVERDGLRPLYGHAPPPPGMLARELLRWNVLWGGASNVIARRELVEDVGGFDEELFQLADWDLWIRLSRETPAAAVDEVVVGLLVHPESMLLVDRRDVFAEFDYLREKHRDAAESAGVVFDRARFARWAAAGHLRAGRRRAASRAYLRGSLALANLLRAAGAFLGPSAFAALSGRRGVLPRTLAEGERVVRAPEWLELYR